MNITLKGVLLDSERHVYFHPSFLRRVPDNTPLSGPNHRPFFRGEYEAAYEAGASAYHLERDCFVETDDGDFFIDECISIWPAEEAQDQPTIKSCELNEVPENPKAAFRAGDKVRVVPGVLKDSSIDSTGIVYDIIGRLIGVFMKAYGDVEYYDADELELLQREEPAGDYDSIIATGVSSVVAPPAPASLLDTFHLDAHGHNEGERNRHQPLPEVVERVEPPLIGCGEVSSERYLQSFSKQQLIDAIWAASGNTMREIKEALFHREIEPQPKQTGPLAWDGENFVPMGKGAGE